MTKDQHASVTLLPTSGKRPALIGPVGILVASRRGRQRASSDFAVHCPAALEPIGEFQVAGFSTEQTVFGLRESETVAIALR
jgi:hypothetical protein